MQPPAAPEHHVLSPTPARALQSAIDAAAEAPRAESPDVDTKIAEVEARLSATISGLFAKLDRQRTLDVEHLERLIAESRSPLAAAAAPQRPVTADAARGEDPLQQNDAWGRMARSAAGI